MEHKKRTVIGVYPLTNTAAVQVYKIDYFEDRVLAGISGHAPGWREITEKYCENTAQEETGFCIGEMFIPFCAVLRTMEG